MLDNIAQWTNPRSSLKMETAHFTNSTRVSDSQYSEIRIIYTDERLIHTNALDSRPIYRFQYEKCSSAMKGGK